MVNFWNSTKKTGKKYIIMPENFFFTMLCKKSWFLSRPTWNLRLPWRRRKWWTDDRLRSINQSFNICLAARVLGQNCNFCLPIPKRDLATKETTPNIGFCSESLGAMLEYLHNKRVTSTKVSDTLENQPTVWPVPHACAQSSPWAVAAMDSCFGLVRPHPHGIAVGQT